MSMVKTQSKFYEGIAKTIRDKTGGSAVYRPEEMPDGVEEVFEAGKSNEHDRFWDEFQQNGERASYQYAFCGASWNKRIFQPKHNIRPSTIHTAFREFAKNEKEALDLAEHLEKLGVTFDLSKCTNWSYAFASANISRLPVIDCRSARDISQPFANTPNLHTIDKLIVHEGLTYTAPFYHATGLKNIVVEGTVAQNDLGFDQSTKLTHASIESIINALSTTTTGLSVTLSKIAVDNAFETVEGAADGSTSAEWAALANTKSNWTINLV